MKEFEKIPWKRIAVEASAIVASILVAFAIDAWWQEHTDSIVEVSYLQALQDDLRRSLELLDEDEAVQRQQVEYLESLLSTDSNTRYSDELRLWIVEGLFNVGTFQPQISALRDLESSGQTKIIRNPAIRRSLASARQSIDGLETTQRDFQRSQESLIDQFLVENFNLADFTLDRPADRATDLSVLGTREFKSRVAFKISLRRVVSEAQSEVRVAFEEALALIEAELEAAD